MTIADCADEPRRNDAPLTKILMEELERRGMALVDTYEKLWPAQQEAESRKRMAELLKAEMESQKASFLEVLSLLESAGADQAGVERAMDVIAYSSAEPEAFMLAMSDPFWWNGDTNTPEEQAKDSGRVWIEASLAELMRSGAARCRLFIEIDQVLDGNELSFSELKSLKDKLLEVTTGGKSMSFGARTRLARINRQLQALCSTTG